MFVFEKLQKGLSQIRRKILARKPDLEYLDQQDLSRFSEQDIVLESEKQIQKYLPEVLGQALLNAKVLGPRGQNVMESNHHVTMDINLVQGNKDKKYEIVKTFYNVKPNPEL